MKIKSHRLTSLNYKRVWNFLRKRNWLTVSIWALAGMFGSVIIFLMVFNYGGYLYTSGQTKNYRYGAQMLKNVAKLDFSFFKNIAEGQLIELDDISIDLKFKHLLRIRYLRDQANKEKVINSIYKQEEFPAKLTFNGKVHLVKISLTGKMSRTHLGDPNKWSLQVKVRGDDTVKGMKRFGLLLPTVRGYLTDWLSVELMKERGLIGLRIDFVQVSINGKSNGVYYLEERFDKHLIENNRLREGIIFKLEKNVLPYRETKLMQKPQGRSQLLMLKRMWQDVMAGHLPPEQFFDMEKMAKLFVIADLINIGHPLNKENLRLYFNPVTGLVEPIAREFEDLEVNDPSTMKVFLEKPKPFSTHFWHKEESVIGIITGNDHFKRFYIQEAAEVCQKEFLDKFFAKKKDEINAIKAKLYRAWPYYKMPVQNLYDNQQYIRSVLFPEKDEVIARFNKKQRNQISIYLENQQSLPLEISHLSWRDSIIFLPENPIVLDKVKSQQEQPVLSSFQLPEEAGWTDMLLPELKIHYHLLGLPARKKAVLVLPSSEDRNKENSWDEITKEANYKTFEFIEEESTKNILFIPAGNWTLSRDLIIPANKYFQIKAGAHIDLVNHAKIISYSPVFCQGREKQPVVIRSSDSTGEGLTVIHANQRSNLSHTQFDQLSSPQESSWPGNGAVTFYKSPVNIISTTFSNHHQGKDYLQIIRTDFTIDHSRFEKVHADAIDGSFCTGTITNSSFHNIGEDGIDLSGAEVKLSNIFMNDLEGQGLNASKNSRLEARWIDIRQADTGITCKDQSNISLFDVQLIDNRIGLAVFQEKNEYGPAYVSVKGLRMQRVETSYLVEKNSSLILEDTPQVSDKEKVKEKLYGIK